MKKTKVITEVESIINSNMRIREKIEALNRIHMRGRPGRKQATSLIAQYTQRLADKKRLITKGQNPTTRKNSTPKFYKQRAGVTHTVSMMGDYVYSVIKNSYTHGYSEFAKRFESEYLKCCIEYANPLLFDCWGTGTTFAQAYVWIGNCAYGKWKFIDKDMYTFRKELGKKLANVCAPYLQEYKETIQPEIEKRQNKH